MRMVERLKGNHLVVYVGNTGQSRGRPRHVKGQVRTHTMSYRSSRHNSEHSIWLTPSISAASG